MKDVTQTEQQRPESPTVTLTCHVSKYKGHELHQRCIDPLQSQQLRLTLVTEVQPVQL